MGDLIAPLLDKLLDPIRAAVARIARSAAELALVGVFALVGLGFLIAALVIWLSSLVGPLYATLIMAGISFVLMIIVLAVWMASNAADKHKAEAEKKRKEEERRRSAVGGPSLWRTAMSLAPLVSMVAKRTRRTKAKARSQARAVAHRTERTAEALGGRVAEDARLAAALAGDASRKAAAASREALRGSMQGVGPWVVVAVAAGAGALLSRAIRRR